MDSLFRIIDANINRASEGARVLEDLARFHYNDGEVSGKLKKLRHEIRKNVMTCMPLFLQERDSQHDVGFQVSNELRIDEKASRTELIAANFKRMQEALRVVEENLRLTGRYELSKVYEYLRFQSYQLEKEYSGMRFRRSKAQKLHTDLYCITAEEHSRGRNNIEVVRAMMEAGIKVIQYREKDKKVREKYNECLKIREMTQQAGVTFIVNDNIDIAISVKADGVHIGQDDMPIEKVRELVGEEMIIGLSTHSPEQAQDAVRRGADYIGVGPIYKTYTKKDVCDPVGLEYLEYVVKHIRIPFVAIGGIKEHNLHEVRERGAACIALVTEIVGAEDIREKIGSIRQKLKGEKQG